jgi:hypothetical protein
LFEVFVWDHSKDLAAVYAVGKKGIFPCAELLCGEAEEYDILV